MSDPTDWRGVTLVLDGAAGAISIALLVHGDVVGERIAERTGRASTLGPAEQVPSLVRALRALGPEGPIARVVVGAGPGSFTGLRAAAAFAKGIAHGGGVPLYAIPSLSLMVARALDGGRLGTQRHVVATLDALRGERFAQSFAVDAAAGTITPVGDALRVPASAQSPEWIGPGTAVDVLPSAAHATRVLSHATPVEITSWEPVYGRLAEAQVQWEAAHATRTANG
ncbi:MAG: tRNA (adenosine(37)-N6)-threonylcarbamoyltransferase complex dimerization subunit type 1 TsaB [Gemmatimonadaceae bacterium]|jgi:tRNA threonylcarbamoyladenosine biosynthesis protein TsaB|nr:tRNA (adenosine(37)-N6)-threonylcarbamoyltransferase complex dimerization subunit type 1 TsaB [Gemmatimonadaceae bacterium]